MYMLAWHFRQPPFQECSERWSLWKGQQSLLNLDSPVTQVRPDALKFGSDFLIYDGAPSEVPLCWVMVAGGGGSASTEKLPFVKLSLGHKCCLEMFDLDMRTFSGNEWAMVKGLFEGHCQLDPNGKRETQSQFQVERKINFQDPVSSGTCALCSYLGRWAVAVEGRHICLSGTWGFPWKSRH